MPYDPGRRRLIGPSGSCPVSQSQHDLLVRFRKSLGTVLSYDSLLTALWQLRPYPQTSPAKARMTLKVEVAGIRAKLRAVDAPESIANVVGHGYVLRASSERPLWLDDDQRAALRGLLRDCAKDPRARRIPVPA